MRAESETAGQPGRLLRARPAGDQRGVLAWLPGVHVFRHYRRAWLQHDLVAGLVLTAMLVPVGMAYAQASGLPAIFGLYATIFPLLAYAVFGPSRILVVGPDSSLAPMIAAMILPLAAGDAGRAVVLAGALAVLSGLLCILAGLARLGFVTELLSKPIRYGYMNGIALTVLVGQLPRLFGFSVSADGLLPRLARIGEALAAGRTNWVSLALGAGTLVVILVLKRWKGAPGVLIAVVGATLIVTVLDLARPRGDLGGRPAAPGAARTGPAHRALRKTSFHCSPLRSPSRRFPLPRRACCRGAMRPRPAPTSTRIAKWSGSARPTWSPDYSRAFRSAAARRARPWPKGRAPARS